MGSSYASKLTKLGHDVYGYDINQSTYAEALKHEIIKESLYPNIIKEVEVVISTLYPHDTIDFLRKYEGYFNNKQLLTDIAGVKKEVIEFIENNFAYKSNYVSHHPMAGREKQSHYFYDDSMFKDANCIIVNQETTNIEAVNTLTYLLSNFGFRKIIETTSEKHDFLISYTSQLTHAIAISLINLNDDDLTFDATGDSFRDLTRIAKINEFLWSELFLENKDELINQITTFTNELDKLKKILIADDKESLKIYMRQANERRKKYDRNNNGKI